MRAPGLHLDLNNLQENRCKGIAYWGQEFQREIAGTDLRRFLPEVHFAGSSQERHFVLMRGGQECCGTSVPVRDAAEIPTGEMQALRDCLTRFKGTAAGDQGREGGNMNEMIQKFELPDPKEYPTFYRLYCPHWWSRKRLAVIWGCKPYERDYGRVVLVPQTTSSRWWLWLLLLPLIALAVWLAFLFWPKGGIVPGDDPYAHTVGQFLQLRWLPKTGVAPVKLEARALRPGAIDFQGLLRVDTPTDQWKALPEIKKPGKYRITWTPADHSLNTEFKEVSFTGPAGESRLPTATLYLQPNPALPGQEVTAVVSASTPGVGAAEPGLRYFVQWEPGTPMEEVDEPDTEPATHTFAAPGDYPVTLRVQRPSDPGEFAGDIATAHIQTAAASAPSLDRRPVPVARLASLDPESRRVVVADAGSYMPDGGKITRYTIDWNDGSVEDFAAPPARSHQYATALPSSGQITYLCRGQDGQLGALPLLLAPPGAEGAATPAAASRQVLGAGAATDQLRIERHSERPVGRGLYEEVLAVVGPLTEGDRWTSAFKWRIATAGGGKSRTLDEHSRGISIRLPAGNFDVSALAYDLGGTTYEGSARLSVPAKTEVDNLDRDAPLPSQEEEPPPAEHALARTEDANPSDVVSGAPGDRQTPDHLEGSPATDRNGSGTSGQPDRSSFGPSGAPPQPSPVGSGTTEAVLPSPTQPPGTPVIGRAGRPSPASAPAPVSPVRPPGRRVASGGDDASPSPEERADARRQANSSPAPGSTRRAVATPPADDDANAGLAAKEPAEEPSAVPATSPRPAEPGQPAPQPRVPHRPVSASPSGRETLPASGPADEPAGSPSEADQGSPTVTPSPPPTSTPQSVPPRAGDNHPVPTPDDGGTPPPPSPQASRFGRPPVRSKPTPLPTPPPVRIRVLAPNLVLLPTQVGNKLWKVQAILLKDEDRLQPESVQWTLDGKQQSSQGVTVEFEPTVENPRIEAKASYRGAVYTASRPLVDPNAQP